MEPEKQVGNGNERISVTIWLLGDESVRFLRYQSKQKLRAKAEAARKLLLERLDEVDAAETSGGR
jgi:hypothetical protein